MIIEATCSICDETTEYRLDALETDRYKMYQYKGREMGLLQNVFPNVPAWIRSGAIDKYSGGFCICPKCGGF